MRAPIVEHLALFSKFECRFKTYDTGQEAGASIRGAGEIAGKLLAVKDRNQARQIEALVIVFPELSSTGAIEARHPRLGMDMDGFELDQLLRAGGLAFLIRNPDLMGQRRCGFRILTVLGSRKRQRRKLARIRPISEAE